MTTYTIDLTDLLIAVITLVFPIIGYFASLAFRAIADKFHMQADSERRILMERAIANGIAKAEALAIEFAKANGRAMTTSERVAIIATHVTTTAGSVSKGLNIEPAELRESIRSRLPEAKAAAEAAREAAAILDTPPPPKPDRVAS